MAGPAFRRILLLSALLAVAAHSALAAAPGRDDWWYTLRRGQAMFARGDYGNALLAFEDARRDRLAMYEGMERDLVDFLSLSDARRLGDSLDLAERVIRERHFTRAAAALDELYFRVPRERFGNSAAAALDAIGRLRHFPEAEMWIGRTLRAGGELGLAVRQFELALSHRDLLENPADGTEILYEIAAIRRARDEFREMERVLLSILDDSVLWAGAGEGWQAGTFARDAMTRTLQLNGAERLITLYRYGNATTLRAHRELGLFYASSGRHGRAQEHLMFAFIIQNTLIIDELIRRRFDFSFTTLEALADEIRRDAFLSEYAEETGYFSVAFYLGNSLFGNGHAARAREIWSFLSVRDEAGEWQVRAASQLRSPRVAPLAVVQ